MTSIHRYNENRGVTTPLDPIEDVTSWISGLRSIGYASDILSEVHGFSRASDIKESASLISQFSSISVGLIEQAYSGPPEISFLPLYYSISNLSKIYVVLSKQRSKLESHRWHGASYNPHRKRSRDLLTEKLNIKERGIFQLFYTAITGEQWTRSDVDIKMSSIYPYIMGVSHEFSHAYGIPSKLQYISLKMKNPNPDEYRLEVTIGDVIHPEAHNSRHLRLFTGFRPLEEDPNKFASRYVTAGSENEALSILARCIRRCLLYYQVDPLGNLHSLTPISSMQLLLPPEVPIWLSFFHLSNVVRYHPEFLYKLMESKAWPLLLTMRRHSMLAFMLNFWSFLHQTNYYLIIQ